MTGARRLVATAGGVGLLLLLWAGLHRAYGPLVLPSPVATGRALAGLIGGGIAGPAVARSAANALGGFLLGGAVGTALGIAAGSRPLLGWFLAPLITITLGVPPIAWAVLSLLWFGTGVFSPMFTVVVTTLPIAFAGAAQGVRTLDADLAEMARAFGASRRLMLVELMVPHLLSYLVPALAVALGFAWKVEVMAEVMGAGDGIGAGLALARANLDTAEATAWIVLVAALVLGCDTLLLSPLARRLEAWRRPGTMP